MKRILKSNNYYGQFLILIGMLLLVPLVTLLFYPEDISLSYAFIIPAMVSILLGLGICYWHNQKKYQCIGDPLFMREV